MGIGAASARAVISLIGAIVPLLFLSGSSFSPLGAYLPNLPNLFGNGGQLSSMLGISSSDLSSLNVLPFGAGGVAGLATYGLVQRVLSTATNAATRATYSAPRMDASAMMRNMQASMPFMAMQGTMQTPKALPPDMTRSQSIILQKISAGQRKPKDIAKILSVDKHEVEKEIAALRT